MLPIYMCPRSKSFLKRRWCQVPGTLPRIGNQKSRTLGTRKVKDRVLFFGCRLSVVHPFRSQYSSFTQTKTAQQHTKMMFSKFSLIVLVAIMALASATDYGYETTVSKARPAVRWALSPNRLFPLTFSPAPLLYQ
jgi:hypothetical protein